MNSASSCSVAPSAAAASNAASPARMRFAEGGGPGGAEFFRVVGGEGEDAEADALGQR
jgi:hypothetical protein